MKTNADGSFTLALREPIKALGEEIKEVSFRRPRAKVYRAMASMKDEASRVFALVASVCGVTPSAVEEMDLADFNAIVEAIGDIDPKL